MPIFILVASLHTACASSPANFLLRLLRPARRPQASLAHLSTISCRFAPHRLRVFPWFKSFCPVAARSAAAGLVGSRKHHFLSLRSTQLARLPLVQILLPRCRPLGGR